VSVTMRVRISGSSPELV